MPTYVKITDLPDVPISLTGEELLEIVQGGTSYSATTQQIANLGGGGGGAVTSVAGRTGAVTLTSNDLTDATTTGQALITAASQTAARTALGLGDLATVTPGSGVATALAANLNSTNGLMALDGAGNANFPSLASAFSALYIGTEPHTISIGASSGTAAWVNTDGSFSLSGGNLVGDTSGNVTMFGNILASNGDKWADVNNRIIYDQYNEQAISTVSDTWNTDYLTTLISDPDYGYVAINGQLFVRNSIQVQPFGGSSVTQLNYDGSASFANGYVTIDTSGDVQIVNQSLIVSNTGNEAVMRLSEKSNGEVTWAYNVNPNNSDSLDNTTDMAWKFAMAGVNSTSSINIQSSPANSDSWTGTKLWSISATGALYMDSGVIITDGSGNMQWGNGEAGYITVINSSGELQYPSGDQLLTDTAGRLYYSTGVTLADNAANLYYGNGTSKLSDSNSQLYYGDGSNLTVNDSGLYLLYPTIGRSIADFAGRLYYGDGSVMTDPTVDVRLLYYPTGSSQILADSNGYLFVQTALLVAGNSNLPAIDSSGNFYYPNNTLLSQAQMLYGPDGNVLVDSTVSPIQLNYPGLGSVHPLANGNGALYRGGNGGGQYLIDDYDNLYISTTGGGIYDSTSSLGAAGDTLGLDPTTGFVTWRSGMYFDNGAITSDGSGNLTVSGSIGIGTNSPLSPLDVESYTINSNVLTFGGNYTVAGQYYGIAFYNNSAEIEQFAIRVVSEDNYGADAAFWTKNNDGQSGTYSEKMRLMADGNLLIGTTTDDGTHLFQVAGSVSLDSGAITSDGSGNLTAASLNANNGYTGTVTTSSLVGKTITITNGIVTGFA